MAKGNGSCIVTLQWTPFSVKKTQHPKKKPSYKKGDIQIVRYTDNWFEIPYSKQFLLCNNLTIKIVYTQDPLFRKRPSLRKNEYVISFFFINEVDISALIQLYGKIRINLLHLKLFKKISTGQKFLFKFTGQTQEQ